MENGTPHGRMDREFAPAPRASRALLLLRSLCGRAPAESLREICVGDPLGLSSLTAGKIRERALLIQQQRLFEASLIEVAFEASLSAADEIDSDWIAARVDRAIARILDDDAEAEREGRVGEADADRFSFVATTLGATPQRARKATVAFNALPSPTRRAFFALVIDERPLSECTDIGVGSPAEATALARDAMWLLEQESLLWSDAEESIHE